MSDMIRDEESLRQDLPYSHTRVIRYMSLYRNTQPAHTTALIQGTYYQHEPANSVPRRNRAMLRRDREIEELSARQ